MAVAPPYLESSRLVLRAHETTDLAASATMWADANVVKFIGGVASTEQQVWSRLLSYRGLWALLGFGYWVIEEKSTGLFVGEVGFADFRREITPSLAGLPEAGWALVPSAFGKGYATEALQTALVWLDKTPCESVCIVAPSNTQSLKVAGKNGFSVTQTTKFRDADILLLRRPARS